MKKKVITTTPDEAVDIAVQKLEQHNISALPVVDKETPRDRHAHGNESRETLWREVAEMKLLVTFSRKKGESPIIAQVVRDTGVLINVERAVIDSSEGEALIEVPDDQCKLVSDTMVSLGATRPHPRSRDQRQRERVRRLRGLYQHLPPRGLLVRQRLGNLQVDEDRCVLCGRCVDACPHRALSLCRYDPRAVSGSARPSRRSSQTTGRISLLRKGGYDCGTAGA